MSSDNQDNTSEYRVEYVTPENSKLRMSEEAFRKLDQEAFLVATVKVSQEGYVPPGIEVRTWIGPLIFTANIPREVLEQLEQDPAVVTIEPVYNLRSY
jgi:predicted DNA-binding transcriptional regulator